MSDRPYVIFAPHVDDETIGCWRLLNQGLVSEVHYFFEVDHVRKFEAIAAACLYGFNPVFHEGLEKPVLPEDAIIMAPHIKDQHPHHKEVNYLAKSMPNKVSYYSVDMNVDFFVLSEVEREKKKEDLFTLYPSQSNLFSNEKYFLFESHMYDDVITYYTLEYKNVIITSSYTHMNSNKCASLINSRGEDLDGLMRDIITLNPEGYVKLEMRFGNTTAIKEFNPR